MRLLSPTSGVPHKTDWLRPFFLSRCLPSSHLRSSSQATLKLLAVVPIFRSSWECGYFTRIREVLSSRLSARPLWPSRGSSRITKFLSLYDIPPLSSSRPLGIQDKQDDSRKWTMQADWRLRHLEMTKTLTYPNLATNYLPG